MSRRLVELGTALRLHGPQLALAIADGTSGTSYARLGSGGPGTTMDTGASSDTGLPDAEQDRIRALVTLAQGGDNEAFGEIYDCYVEQVYRYLFYRVGSRTLAEDLTSETFLRALRSIATYTWQGRDIGAWFVTIARNLVTDHLKSSRFRLEITTADMLDADRATEGVEDSVLARLDHIAVLDAVRLLKADQQECLVLRFVQDLSVADTAAAMGRSVGAVKQLQLRAVRALARQLPDVTNGPSARFADHEANGRGRR